MEEDKVDDSEVQNDSDEEDLKANSVQKFLDRRELASKDRLNKKHDRQRFIFGRHF